MTQEKVIAEIIGYHSVFTSMEAETLTMHPDSFDDVMKEIGLENWRRFEQRPKIHGLFVELDTGFPKDQVVVDGNMRKSHGVL